MTARCTHDACHARRAHGARFALFALLLAFCAALRAVPVPAAGEIQVAILTDIHYLAESLHDDGTAFRKLVYEGDGKNTELIRDILEAFRFTLKREKPDILIVTGDLTLNGEKASHLELASWFGEVESSGVKVFVLPGNHDINNPWAMSFSKDKVFRTQSVTREEFRAAYRAFGFDEAISRDADTLGYVVEPVPGLRILMLDSTIHSDNMRLGYPEAGGAFGDGTLDWIASTMAKAKAAGARTLVAMHHNMVDHNPFISEGYTLYDAESALARFAEAGIDLALTGHVHVQDISEQATARGAFSDIATNALSVYPHNYGSLTVSPGKRTIRYRAIPVDVAAWARASGVRDERLTDFASYSLGFFRDRSAFMVGRMLARGDARVAPERAKAMVDLFGTLNARFFSGKAYLNANDTIRSAAYLDLAATDYEFLSAYAQSIIDDPSPENGALEIAY